MRKTFISLLVCLFLALTAMNRLQSYSVIGSSMYPKLKHLDKVFGISIKKKDISRGGVYVLEINHNGNTTQAIKRCIGLPGDKVCLMNNDVYIITEDTICYKFDHGRLHRSNGNIEKMNHQGNYIDNGMYFFIGDNVNTSFDSRQVGPIPRNSIISRMLFKY